MYLYGSTARGEDTESSDVDLPIIGTIDEHMLSQVVWSVENAMGRDVRLLVKNPVEYAELSRTNSAFYENLTCDRIRII